MAQPITYEWPVSEAPKHDAGQYSEALHSAQELLQLLHEKGVLSLLRGMLGAGDELVGSVSKAMATPESVRAIRNLILLAQLAASINPDTLSSLIETMHAARERKAPGMLELLWRFRSENNRKVIAAGLDLMEGIGKGL